MIIHHDLSKRDTESRNTTLYREAMSSLDFPKKKWLNLSSKLPNLCSLIIASQLWYQ